VEIARKNSKSANVIVDFEHGNVCKMPYKDEYFDFIICTAAFKNFKAPVAALDEMHRVLKHGGKVLIIDMNRNASIRELNQYVKEMKILGFFDKIFMKIMFSFFLKNGAYSPSLIT